MFHTSVQMAHLILPPFDLKIIMATIQHLKILFRERDGKKGKAGGVWLSFPIEMSSDSDAVVGPLPGSRPVFVSLDLTFRSDE